MLVQPHPRADDRGLADYHAGAMVDEEARPDRRARMDVDAGARIGDLGDDARHQRRAQLEQLMRQPVVHHRHRAGVADQDLVDAARGGIALEGGGDIAVDQPADLGQGGGEQADDGVAMIAIEPVAGLGLPIAQLAPDLRLEQAEGLFEAKPDEDVLGRALEMAEPLWEQRRFQMLEHELERDA